MKKIIEFFSKWGTIINCLLIVCVFFSTCGVKGTIERDGRRLDKIDKTIAKMDSTIGTKISADRMDILLEINALEIAREVVFTNNSIVRTTQRPDDVMNAYNKKIESLQEKLKNVK